MARKTKAKPEDEEIILEDPPSSIDPYATLSIDKSATAHEIKSAYRKAALKHHPDKATLETKDTAHKRFQEVAFAYAILSDERRRKRYDATGNTSESLDLEDDDFNWTDFFREQTATMVDGKTIEKIKREYQGSGEEIEDVLIAYEEGEGDMNVVHESVMCSNVLDDDERFRKIIDGAIKDKKVQKYDKYVKESKASRKKRLEKAKGEEQEAMELAEELGIKDQLFGNGAGKKSKKGESDEDALQALISQRQKERSGNFMDQLEEKYGGGAKKGKRKAADEPSEEAFQKNAKKKVAKK